MINHPDPLSKLQHAQAILVKATPLIFLFGSDFISKFTRTYLLSKISFNALEAITIADNITSVILYSIPELMSQDAVFISEIYGKNKSETGTNQPIIPEIHDPDRKSEDEIGKLVRQGWLLSSLVSVPAISILLICKPYLVDIFNSPAETSNLANDYILIFAMSIPLEFINRINERSLSAVDQEQWLFPYRILAMSVEIGLNFLLIPKYSASGAAYASLGKSVISLCFLSLLFALHPGFQRFEIFKGDMGKLSSIKKILSQGWPVLVAQLAMTSSAYVVTNWIGRLGPGRLAVEQVVGQYSGFMLSINFAINESTNRITAQFYGAKNYNETRRAGNISYVVNGIVLAIGIAIINIIPLQFSSLFLDKEKLQEYATMLKYMFIIISLYNVVNVHMENSKKILSGSQDTFAGSMLSLLATVGIILPLSAISAYGTDFDIYGIAGSMVIGKLIGASLTFAYWQHHSNNFIESNNQTRTSNSTGVLTGSRHIFFLCNKSRREYRTLDQAQIEISDTIPLYEQNNQLASI